MIYAGSGWSIDSRGILVLHDREGRSCLMVDGAGQTPNGLSGFITHSNMMVMTASELRGLAPEEATYEPRNQA